MLFKYLGSSGFVTSNPIGELLNPVTVYSVIPFILGSLKNPSSFSNATNERGYWISYQSKKGVALNPDIGL
jgi:hypothetical protein